MPDCPAGCLRGFGATVYRLLIVTGSDAANFLQGQLTQDIDRVGSDFVTPAAICTPKGRVIATLDLLRVDDTFVVRVAEDLLDTLVAKLTMYRLRAKVEFDVANPQASVAWVDAGDIATVAGNLDYQQSGRAAFVDGVLLVARNNLLEATGAVDYLQRFPNNVASEQDHLDALCRNGNLRIGAAMTEKFTPHMLSLDLAGAINFEKGCYTGQEIVARTEHRGASRRRLAHYRFSGKAGPGNELFHNDRAVGTVVQAGAEQLFAVVPADLHEQTLRLEDGTATPATN